MGDDAQFPRAEVDALRQIRQAPRGRAGGKRDAAGGQLPTGVLQLVSDAGAGKLLLEATPKITSSSLVMRGSKVKWDEWNGRKAIG
jgi:hypothetical protein